MPPLLLKLIFDKVASAPMPFFAKPIAKGIAAKVLGTVVQPNIDAQLKFLEAELASRPWFAGAEFSAADVQMSFPLEAAAARAGRWRPTRSCASSWRASMRGRPTSAPWSVVGRMSCLS